MELPATRILLLAVICTPPAIADNDKDVARPQVYVELVKCKEIADPTQRLACFDAASAKIEQAADAKDIVILDRTEVKKTKRSLFGFQLPKIKFFDDDEKDESNVIETTFASVNEIGYGKYQFEIPDGGTWQTTEPSRRMLRVGQKVKIKRAAVGSFMMQADNGAYVRVKRIN
jgi:hypothetical protein